jgi:hypothetical protein
MDNETLSIVLTIVGMAAALIWLIIRLATKPLEQVVKNNTTAGEDLGDSLPTTWGDLPWGDFAPERDYILAKWAE